MHTVDPNRFTETSAMRYAQTGISATLHERLLNYQICGDTSGDSVTASNCVRNCLHSQGCSLQVAHQLLINLFQC